VAGAYPYREEEILMAVLSRCAAVLAAAGLLAGAALAHAAAKDKEKPDPAAKLRVEIRETVPDSERAGRMLAAVDEIEAAIREVDALIAEERAALAALLRDHGSERAAVDASLAAFAARREPLAQRVLAAHVALKGEATAAEWKKLRKTEMDMLMFAASKSIGRSKTAGKES
jgi:hypothetical protein